MSLDNDGEIFFLGFVTRTWDYDMGIFLSSSFFAVS